MPGLQPATAEQLLEGQRLLREQIKPPVTLAKNVAVAQHLDAPMTFTYRGRRYVAPPPSYRQGVELQELLMEINRLGDDNMPETHETLAQLVVVLDHVAQLAPTLCRPTNWFKRLLWRVGALHNPFLTASPQELAQLIGFFLQCQMRSRVQLMGSSAHRLALSSSTRLTN